MRARFELFAGLSLAAHLGLVAWTVPRSGAVKSGAGSSANSGAAAAVGGDTFDVPEIEESPEEDPGEAKSAEPTPVELDEPGTSAGAHASHSPPASPLPSHARGARHSAAPPPPPEPAAYGALGDRSAGDLIATFKRVFPIAASSDPLWNRVPVGFYADGDVTFTLAPDGTLTDATASAGAAPAFHAAIARTTALLRHRLFTASGAVTRLHMVVRVTDKLVNHGAFTIDAAGSFELPSGRHVSVAITAR